MSSKVPCDRYATSSSISGSNNIYASINSGFTSDPTHRGSLTTPKLDSIH